VGHTVCHSISERSDCSLHLLMNLHQSVLDIKQFYYFDFSCWEGELHLFSQHIRYYWYFVICCYIISGTGKEIWGIWKESPRWKDSTETKERYGENMYIQCTKDIYFINAWTCQSPSTYCFTVASLVLCVRTYFIFENYIITVNKEKYTSLKHCSSYSCVFIFWSHFFFYILLSLCWNSQSLE
jgi:hypothetical protein